MIQTQAPTSGEGVGGERDQALLLNIDLDKIQGIRLAHALMETGRDIRIPPAHGYKFQYLRKYFPFSYSTETDSANLLQHVSFCHETPSTRIGNLERALIFPQAAFGYCQSLWPAHRSQSYLFIGLLTGKRKRALQDWIDRVGSRLRLDTRGLLFQRILRRFGLVTALKRCDQKMKFKIWESDRGRIFPVKVWHDEYYREMADSRFVLCPDGDFIWTYRFFEAAMCGAIPVVENTCPHYEGFIYYAMKEDPGNHRWSLEAAMHNFNLCRERLTIPHHLLTEELRKSS